MAKDGSVDVIIQKQAIDNIALANTALEKTLQTILAINKASRGGKAGSSPNDAEKINESNKASIQRLKLADQTLVMQKKLVQSEINLKNALSKENAEIQKNRFELQRRNTLLKEEIKLASPLVGAYEKLSIKLNKLRRAYKDVAASEGLASKNAIKLRKEVERLDARLVSVDRSARQFQRNVGNYPRQMGAAIRGLRSLAGALGLVGGAFLAVRVVGNAITTMRNFEKQNATLSAVLQVEKKNMTALIKESQRLGKVTVKSADEVVGLQIAFARLGFSQREVIDLTEATISGSIAMNSELSETANLVGAMVNSFDDFSAVDAPEIIDVLSLATAKSALNFQKLEKGLPIVAGAANAAGISFTKVVALMGKLADAGIDVSTSSTAIRNIFIEAASKGADYNEILEMIKGSQDKLTAANDQFGKRAAVSASVLANNIDQIKELDEALQDAAGTAQSMADKELDTLDGSVKLLSSAWKGLVLNINDGEGAMASFMRGTVDLGTGFLTMIDQVSLASDGFVSFTLNLWRAGQMGGIVGIMGDNINLDFKLEKLDLILELSMLTREEAEKNGEAESQIRFKMFEINKLTTNELKAQIALFAKMKEDRKKANVVLKLTVDHYRSIISTTRQLRDSTAETTEEYRKFTKVIDKAADAIKRLQGAFGKMSLSTPILPGKKSTISPISGGLGTPQDTGLAVRGSDPKQEAADESDRLDKLFELQEQARQMTQDLQNEAIDSTIGLANTLFDRKIALIDAEIFAEENKYAMLFALAEGDAEQQRLLAIEREENLQKLEKKRSKELKKQAIFNKSLAIAEIGIKLAQTIAAIQLAAAEIDTLTFGIGGNVYRAVQIPLAIGIASAQAATVLATPIPQFAKGGTMDKDGLAIVGDGGRKEVIKNPDGTIQVTPDKSTLVSLKKGAEIVPSIEAFNAEIPTDISDKIYNATIMASLSINNNKINGYLESQKVFNDKLLGAMLQVDKSIKKQKLSSTSQRIDIADELYKMRY